MRISDRWWSAVAPVYDAAVRSVGWHRYQDSLVIDTGPGPVLDVGCGPAHLCTGLVRRGVGYVGVDRNAAMLQRARQVTASSSVQVALVRADATALPFREECFDTVVATAVLGLLGLESRRAALHEMARVVRCEVRLLEPVDRPDRPQHEALSRWVALVRDSPLELQELIEAGLQPVLVGPPVLAGVYSFVHATKVRKPTPSSAEGLGHGTD